MTQEGASPGRLAAVAPILTQAPAVPAWHPWVILLTAPVVLTLWWYFGRFPFFDSSVAPHLPPGPFEPVYAFVYFTLSSVLLRGLVPLLVVTAVLREPLSRYGWRLKGTFDLWYVYLALVLLAVPLVWLASAGEGFQGTYPQCRRMLQGGTVRTEHFLLFQVCYLLVFASGESFWRGFLSFGLFRSVRWLAIPIMVVPYVMIHFGKPFPETAGALVAGTILGTLALKHGTFWLGVLTHYSVALWMDVAAMIRQGIVLV